MQNKLLFPIVSALLLTMIPASGAVVLVSGGGFSAGTIDGALGNIGNNMQDIAFTTPLPDGKTNLASLANGDILSLSFDMSFTAIKNTDLSHLSVGFMSGTPGNNSGNSVFYALIRPNENLGAPTFQGGPASGFKTRSGSVFASTGGSALGDAIYTDFIHTGTIAETPILAYSVTLSVEKINATDVEMFLQIGDNEFTETITWPNSTTFNADITRLGFRNNAGDSFDDLAISNVEVLLIPEPSTVTALIGAVAGLAVILRRRRQVSAERVLG